MSLQRRPTFEIAHETRRVAHAAFPHGTLSLQLADPLGTLYADERFSDLFPRRGQPAEAPGRLAWVRNVSSKLRPQGPAADQCPECRNPGDLIP